MTTTPLVSPDVDLRDFPFMPLDAVRLRDSDLAAVATGDEFRAAVLLWCASWHQVPAASLPSDDRMLAKLAGYGRDLAGWAQVKIEALRNFTECSDGRLYHPVIAEKAIEAWEKKQSYRARTEAARNARLNKVQKPNDTENATSSVTEFVDSSVTDTKGQGQGQGQGQLIEERILPETGSGDSVPTLFETPPAPTESKPPKPTEPKGFAEFYAAYPKHVDRAAAAKKFAVVVKGGITADTLIAAATQFAKYCRAKQTEPKYIKSPEVWLNKGCWTDDLPGFSAPPPPVAPGTPAPPPASPEERARRLLKIYCNNGFVWHWPDRTPPPGDPDCRLPMSVLLEFRDQLPNKVCKALWPKVDA